MVTVIYALFDDGAQSVYKIFENDSGVQVFSFGIQKKETVIPCDLSDIKNFEAAVKGLPAPDIILASPPCETFSSASNGSMASGRTGNIYYYTDGSPIIDFNDWKSHTCMNIVLMADKLRGFQKIQEVRRQHEKLHQMTQEIVERFGVPFAIENPMRSLCFKKYYQNSADLLTMPYYYDAVTYYNAYGSVFLKPTRIRSSQPLGLRKKPISAPIAKIENIKNYNKRSEVPEELIKSIVEQLV